MAWIIVAGFAINAFGCADGCRFAVAMVVAYAIPRLVLARARGSSAIAVMALLVIAMIISAQSILRMLDWTVLPDYSLEMPNLHSDDRGYYKWALAHYDGRVESPDYVVFPGFPLMMVALWKVLGVSVIWPVAMNSMFTMLAVTFTGMTSRRLLHHRVSVSPRVLVAGSIGLCGVLFYYLTSGCHVLKEGSTMLAIAIVGYVLAGMDGDDSDRLCVRDAVLMVVAIALLALVRTTFLYFVAMGIALMGITHWRRHGVAAIGMMAVLAIAFVAGNHFASYSVDNHLVIVDGGWDMQHFYMRGNSQQPYHQFVGNYFLYPWWKRMLLLPLTASVQFITPFPWVSYEPYVLNYILPRVAHGWYAVGGVALFYYFFISWRRHENMGWWPWWPALSFAAIAYVIAGSVSRYVLPFEAMFVPVTMFVIIRLYEGKWRRMFVGWALFYVVLLAAALVCCLEIQTGAVRRVLQRWGCING